VSPDHRIPVSPDPSVGHLDVEVTPDSRQNELAHRPGSHDVDPSSAHGYPGRVTSAEADEYLARIAYAWPREPTVGVLRAVHSAHLYAVPFENLSIRRGDGVVLDEKALFDKIVRRRRGGFCYELNGLFSALLQALGFRVVQVAGRVGVNGIPFDHMALIVQLDEPLLADVGFGDSFLAPLSVESRDPQDGGDGRRYRIADTEDGGLLLSRERDGTWERQYAFTLETWPLSAYADGCRYHSTSPQSHFTQKTVVSRATETGRITLSERRLIVTERGIRRETELADDAAVADALRELFGLGLDPREPIGPPRSPPGTPAGTRGR
jgi:N-hydroxyarylamine O-acetyltransferase